MNRLLQIDWSDIQYGSEGVNRTIYSFPLHIKILWLITFSFILLTLILLLIVIASRIIKTKRTIRRSDLVKQFQPILSELLFNHADSDRESVRKEFGEETLSDPFKRDILLEEILHLHDNFTGESADRLEKIFKLLDLHQDALERLKSKKWHVVARGMRELAFMNVKEAYGPISAYLTHKNEMLRYEARITLMKLNDEDHLAFLDKENAQLSEWDQSYIYTMLCKMPENTIPDFSRWLDSPNGSIVDLSITMTGAFHQQQSVPKLLSMLQSSDESRRVRIIRALKKCGATVSEDSLIARYSGETPDVQKEIINSFTTLGSSKSIQFLSGLLKQQQSDITQTVNILRSLLATGPEGEKAVNDFFLRSDERMRMAVLHAKDQRL